MTNPIDLETVFSRTLVTLGEQFPNMVVVDADLPDSCSTEAFVKAYPDRAWDIGIAEQSLPTVSAGMSMAGLIPVYNSFAVFAVHRGLDMIRQSVAYNRCNVKIVGHAAGQSMGYTGPSHHTLEDIAALRAIPGICILQPSDGIELEQMMRYMVTVDGPVYLRLPRAGIPQLHGPEWKFQPGQVDLIRDGRDITVFATGELVSELLQMLPDMERDCGVSLRLVNVGTLKPLDAESLIATGSDTMGAVTVEDHNRLGGLGGIVAEFYSEQLYKPVQRIGIRDTFTESADGMSLRNHYGCGRQDIREAILKIRHQAQ